MKGQGAAAHEDINLIGTPAEIVDKALAFREAGVTHLLGVDRGVVGDGDGGEARGFPCPGCGAPLPFDGQERALECPYCHAHAWIPDSFIYGSSAPVVRRWFLTGPPVAQDAGADLGVPPLYCVADMTVDREENLYEAWNPARGWTSSTWSGPRTGTSSRAGSGTAYWTLPGCWTTTPGWRSPGTADS